MTMVDMLPDDALREIFDFYVNEAFRIYDWTTLVHVCRKWREIVFGSPRRLNLRLVCSSGTPVRKKLNVWPPLPIAIEQYGPSYFSEDNIIAALEHNDRICEINLRDVSSSLLKNSFAAMQGSFPALTRLSLESKYETMPVVPDSFLGRFVQRLQELSLTRIQFPGLSKLLLSATHLTHLSLREIPHSRHMSPDAMAICLTTLTRLEKLSLEFESPQPRPVQESRHLLRHTRSVLPTLIDFCFEGVSEYLEDLVSRIDAPQLNWLHINFFHQHIFDTPQLTQFISRAPRLMTFNDAHIVFEFDYVLVSLFPQPPTFPKEGLSLRIPSRVSDFQLSLLTQLCNSFLPPALIPSVEFLYILTNSFADDWREDFEKTHWLELLHPFTAVRNLDIAGYYFMTGIVPTLQEIDEERVVVLPALQNLTLRGRCQSEFLHDTFEQFAAARQLSGHPIAISHRIDDWS